MTNTSSLRKLRLFLLNVTVTLLLTLGPASESHSSDTMKITIWKPGLGSMAMNLNHFTVQLDGPIDANAASRLRSRLQAIRESPINFYLNSPGGVMSVGMEIGRIIRQTGMATNIGIYAGEGTQSKPGSCYSSCALAFLGGPYRYISKGSEFGVHRFSSGVASANDLDVAQVASARINTYIREMDVDPSLFELMARTGKDQIYILSTQQLNDLNVTNNGRKRPSWTIEAVDGGLYLRGQQETVWGDGKAIFMCGKGVIFNSFAPVNEDQSRSMIRGEWFHSLLVDAESSPIESGGKGRYDGYFLNMQFLLTPEQVQKVFKAKRVGHAIQVTREAPTFVGYTIEIPEAQRQKVNAFLRTCP